jgi:hypothetical protein
MRKTFYGADGDMVFTPIPYADLPPVAADFDAAGLCVAIAANQREGQKDRDRSRRPAFTAIVRSRWSRVMGFLGVYPSAPIRCCEPPIIASFFSWSEIFATDRNEIYDMERDQGIFGSTRGTVEIGVGS